MHSNIFVSKAQFLREMEHRWIMAERLMGSHARVGWVGRTALAEATNDLTTMDDADPVPDASSIMRTA
jgi:hypothetical protein